MRWDMSNYPGTEGGMESLVLYKAIEIANTFDDEKYEEEDIITQSQTQAQKWYENASIEEQEELRKRYPDIEKKDIDL